MIQKTSRGKLWLAVLALTGASRLAAEEKSPPDDSRRPWSFRNHVESVLTKCGCNSGACHGAIAGKNGFRLSLRGFDPAGDHLTLTRGARGRRVTPSDPGRSLMLLKPTGVLPHKGGVRFKTDSLEYRVVSEWIAAGAPPPLPEDPRVEGIEVLPARSRSKPGEKLQLSVRARYSDGSVEEVTRWAKYTASDSSVTTVGDRGEVAVIGSGEGSITVWYQSKIAIATVSVPFENPIPEAAFAAAPRRGFVDELVLKKLRELNLPPSPPAGDAEILRRMHLDTIGVLPTAEETRAFLAEVSPGGDSTAKRDRLIDSLLSRPEFVDYWSYKWSDLLLVSGERLRPAALWSYYGWIRDQVAAGTPWDEFARRVVTARGSTLENGAANFFVLHGDPQSMSETVSLAFLGMSIGCARCHNHPLEKWTNAQYYGMASIFSRVKTKEAPGDGNHLVFAAVDGELVQPLTGRPQPPRPLDGEALASESQEDRREHLARWLTAPENPYFARAIVNRVWANFLGAGLVEKVDDLRLTNPASNEELLSALARFLVEKRFDLKALMREILRSATYQRSSETLPGNGADRRFYSRYYPRRLMAEILLDAISQTIGAPSQFPGYPAGYRALQLPDSSVSSYFLKSFGRPDRVITCECERTAEPNLTQVLHLANGDTVNLKLEAKGNRVEKLLEARTPAAKIVEEVYLSALSRLPTEKERAGLAELIEKAGDGGRRAAVEDLFWSVLSSKEFLFNH